MKRLRSTEATGTPLVRADSAFYGHQTVAAALRGGADMSITVRLDSKVKAAIAPIDDDAWTPIEYTDAIYERIQRSVDSRAEVAEIGFTAFSSKKASRCRADWWCAPSPTSTPPALLQGRQFGDLRSGDIGGVGLGRRRGLGDCSGGAIGHLRLGRRRASRRR